jgi:hypothetical protein
MHQLDDRREPGFDAEISDPMRSPIASHGMPLGLGAEQPVLRTQSDHHLTGAKPAQSDERVQLNAASQVELEIIAAILERAVIEKIRAHLELDPQPRTRGRARDPELNFAALATCDVVHLSPQAII